jgi:tetraprenyl-beta-curcumene synthase
VLVAAAVRELLWGLPAVAREVHAWKARAQAIPDGPLREDALDALTRKRAHADGAALFSILPEGRDPRLLHLLVAYEVMADFLDNVSERVAKLSRGGGRRINLALIEAIDPGESISDHYRDHRWCDDGDYLMVLLQACRESCVTLPSFERVRPLVRRAASLAQVVGLNHEPEPDLRDAALMSWAERECAAEHELMWFESSAAASGWLAVLALLALAAEPDCELVGIAETYAAYLPWTSLAGTMLDSYVDQAEDVSNAEHSYIAHYPSAPVAVQRTRWVIERSARAVGSLRAGHRHAVIAACMVAMYSSKDSALLPARRSTTRSLVSAGGSLAMLMLPVLRLWRIVYALRSA